MLTLTQAVREAGKSCSIHGHGTSWQVCGPYRSNNPKGPSTTWPATSYPKAVRMRTSWRAAIALYLMGRHDENSSWAVDAQLDDPYVPHDLRTVVAVASQKWEGTTPC